MCGINGIVAFRDGAAAVDVDELTRTRDAMRSRAPDAAETRVSVLVRLATTEATTRAVFRS
jgi:asparagine synthetase B (glutamine-hydrolysing)